MEIVQELQQQSTDDRKVQNSHRNSTVTQQPQHPRLRDYKWWLCVSLYIIFLLAGQSAATLLGWLYYDKGGNSKWMATFVQSSGFPILLPLLFYFQSHAKSTKMHNNDSSKIKPKISTIVSLYVAFGLLQVGNNLMYSYGLLYLPVSTYSLLCATQLLFNAVFSYFLNSQKFTALIFNSIVLLTISASLIAINSHSEESKGLPRESVVGLFGSGEWKTLDKEMKEYQKGRASYIMTLLWTAVAWQISSIGMLGLALEVSSLFSNTIGTMGLPIVPILAVIFFDEKINGVKVIALLLAIWSFLSYIYQHYLDDKKAKADKSDSIEVSRGDVEFAD